MRHAVHARLGAAGSRRRLFTLLVHTQTLVCTELEVQACNTYLRRDHASIPGESASKIMLQYPVKVRPMPVGGYEHWATWCIT
jgi:hypothetical protein